MNSNSVIQWYLDENGNLCLVPVDGYTFFYNNTSAESEDWTPYTGPITLPDNNINYYFKAVPTSGDTEARKVSAYLQNSKSGDSASGGVIYHDGGTMTLDDAIFSGNITSGGRSGYGGAIYNNGGSMTLGSAAFNENIASGRIGYGNGLGYGGAICNNGGSMTLNNAAFNGNIASGVALYEGSGFGDGGAIYNNSGSMMLNSAVFSGNVVSGWGTGYYCHGYGRGGAIYNNGGSMTLSDGTFNGNVAKGYGFGYGYGGAVYNNGGSMMLSGVVFSGNMASGNISNYGGAIYNDSGSMVLSNVTFSGNIASGDGYNSGYGYGGAIYNDSGSMALNSAIFSGNSADGSGHGYDTNLYFYGYGGAIYNGNGSMTLSAGTFSGNVARGYNDGCGCGGAICNAGTMTLGSAAFSGNTASHSGGAICNAGTMTLGPAAFSENTATRGGAIYNAEGGTISLADMITLETETDTIVNAGTMIWDLTGNGNVSISNYNLLTNSGMLCISVTSEQTFGEYVLAENANDLTGKGTFNVIMDKTSIGTIAVGQDVFQYDGLCFEIRQENADLVFSVSQDDIPPEAPTASADVTKVTCQNVTVTAEFSDDSVTKEYSLDGNTWNDYTTGIVFTENGTVSFRGTDETGNVSEVTTCTVSNIYKAVPEKTGEDSVINWYLNNIDSKDYLCLTAVDGYTFWYNTVSADAADWTEYTAPVSLADSNTTYYFMAVPVAGDAEARKVSAYLRNSKSGSAVSGGAICHDGGTLTLDDVIFSGNITGNPGYYCAAGGAIYNNDGSMTLGRAVFRGNMAGVAYAAAVGGAIYNNGGSMTLNTVAFSGNIASGSGYGGAIYNNSGSMTLNSAVFSGNIASGFRSIASGGAIYNNGGSMTLNSASFSGNMASGECIATGSRYVGRGYGGAIYNNGGSMTLDSAAFNTNTAAGSGSGEGINGYGCGGAICNENGTIMLGSAAFSGNMASGRGKWIGDHCYYGSGLGGAIYNGGGSITLDSAEFNGNVASGYCEGYIECGGYGAGGAIYNNGGSMTLNSAVFSENSATYGGRGMRYNYSFSGYGSGGAIYNNGGSMTLGRATFSGNTAAIGGAIYNAEDGTISLAGMITLETETDTVVNAGTMIWNLTGMETAVVSDYSLLSNTGTLCISVAAGPFSEDYILAENVDSVSGKDTFTVLVGGTKLDQTLTVDGDVLEHDDNTYELKKSGTNLVLTMRFIGQPKERGSAVYNDGGTLVYGNTAFSGYMATEEGGAVWNSGTITFSDTEFSGNTVSGSGGAIWNSGTISLGDAVLTDNVAGGSGGAIYNSGTLTLGDGTFSGNTAAKGGAIYNAGGTISLTAGTFSGNTTGVHGSAIYNDGGTITLGEVTFSGNTAVKGGAIYNSGTISLTSGTFSGNTTCSAFDGGFGAALFNIDSGTITLGDATFSGNTAGIGGAIWNRGTIVLNDAIFSGNTAARGAGGVICNSGTGTITLITGIFNGNTASSVGGAIYNYSGTLTLGDVTFSGNTASNGGGAIYNRGNLIFGGRIQLETETDTIVNAGTMTWDLTGTEIAVVSDYSLLSNTGTLCIFITSEQTVGEYVLAENANDLTGKNTFSVMVDGTTVGTVTAGQTAMEHNGVYYELRQENTELVFSVFQDDIPPEAPTASADITKVTCQNVTVTAEFSDDSVTKEYSLDGNTWNDYTTGIVFTENGTVSFRGTDAAGNVSEVTTYTVGNIDKVAPVITLTGDTTTPLQSATLTASVDDGSEIYYSTDNESWSKYTGQVIVLENGTYYFKSTDSAGNVGAKTITFTNIIDTTAPVITLTGDTTTPLQSATLTASVDDGSEIYYSTDNESWSQYTGAITVNNNGTYYFKSTDTAGNVGYSEKSFGNIDKEAPQIQNLTAAANASGILFVAEISDEHGLQSAEFRVNNGDWQTWDSQGALVTENGTVEFRATDIAGNQTSLFRQCVVPEGTVDGFVGVPDSSNDVEAFVSGTVNGGIYGSDSSTGSVQNVDLEVTGSTISAAGAGVFAAENCNVLGDSTVVLNNAVVEGGFISAGSQLNDGDIHKIAGNISMTVSNVTMKNKANSIFYGGGWLDNASMLRVSGDVTVSLDDFTASSVTYGGANVLNGSDFLVSGDLNMTVDDGSYTALVAGGIVRSGSMARIAGNAGLTVNGGTFSAFVGVGAQCAAGCNFIVGNNTNLEINGGIYNGVVYAGAFSQGGASQIAGNSTLTINGGTFNNYVYGGSHATKNNSGKTLVSGNASVTIQADENVITFGSNSTIYAGSVGYGVIAGNASVTISGRGEKLIFEDKNGEFAYIMGDSVMYETTGKTFIGGTKSFIFDDFSGTLNSQIYFFSEFHALNGTQAVFGKTQNGLADITTWKFDLTEGETVLTWESGTNRLNGDTMSLAFDEALTESTVIDGGAASVLSGWDKMTVDFNGIEASWDADLGGYADSTRKWLLAADDDNNLKMTRIGNLA